jgi:hypothetical protein
LSEGENRVRPAIQPIGRVGCGQVASGQTLFPSRDGNRSSPAMVDDICRLFDLIKALKKC